MAVQCTKSHLRKEDLRPVSVTEVAEEVIFPEVAKQFVTVQKTLATILAQRMPPMGVVVGVSFAAMRRQLLAAVEAALVTEELRQRTPSRYPMNNDDKSSKRQGCHHDKRHMGIA